MRFLVAIDGSEQSFDALRYALSLAEGVGADVTAAHAVSPEVHTESPKEPLSSIRDADRALILESVSD